MELPRLVDIGLLTKEQVRGQYWRSSSSLCKVAKKLSATALSKHYPADRPHRPDHAGGPQRRPRPGGCTARAASLWRVEHELVVIVPDVFHPTIRREKASTTKATYTMPDHVEQ